MAFERISSCHARYLYCGHLSQLLMTLELKLSDHVPFQVILSGPPSDLHTNVGCWLSLRPTQKTKPFRVCDSWHLLSDLVLQ
jgi:hypothetical protein